ncbi:MAG: divergent polysaccharide deacetylase family protein, partial [Desulfobacterales bacterium]|nr:divergent polysaccharide deacetylase family protein [Desulfobacterales bacterium]
KKKKPIRVLFNKAWLAPALFVLLATVTLAVTGYVIFLRTPPATRTPGPSPPARSLPVLRPAAVKITPSPDSAESPAPPSRAGSMPEKPRLAIIIDDMGFHRRLDNQFLDLDSNLSFSFLPFGPFTTVTARKAHDLGRDVLLHLPMEPSDHKWDPGPGALLLKMSTKELEQNLDADLAWVPTAIGVNNHMGSRFSEDPEAMTALLTMLKQRNLFFIDSLTSANSTGAGLAVAMGIKTARRHIFLDNVQDRTKIMVQLEALVAHAEKYGRAVGIGHPYPATLAALREFQDQLADRVTLVGIHEMLY